MAISQILRHLFVSDAPSASTRSVLVERNIKRIVSVTHRESSWPPAELCADLGIETRVFPIEDTSFVDEEKVLVNDLFPWVRRAIENHEAVLVHCQMGLSRSPSFIVTYLIWRGMPFEDAWELVKERHPDTGPWLETMNSFLACVGSSVPAAHIHRYQDEYGAQLAKVK